ncbi:hypothetical protein [Piscinibacter terrae]|uniref:Uncharacterized protein n=1 Tax=Piscinibacter terrae TaxID=2496871 RepID=A0A3N7HKV7_9BURK|nr:hypothetical protein [Albitalea terrae]RQP22727.1 hypothetical protein DZC73_20735 [Albitalea terrae]
MKSDPSSKVRAAQLAHAQQQQLQTRQATRRVLAGEQATTYRNTRIRTAAALAAHSAMAHAMLAKLKPGPRPPMAEVRETASAESTPEWSEEEDGEEGEENHLLHLGPMHAGPHGRHVQAIGEHGGGHGGRGGSSRDEDEERDDASPEMPRRGPGARIRVAVAAPVRMGVQLSAVDTTWAQDALAAGGMGELRRALAERLLGAAHGPGSAGWRKPWLGQVAALYATAQDRSFEHGSFGGVRELLLSLRQPLARMLPPNPMRPVFFCLLPLVLFDLHKPFTPSQRQDKRVRLAALSRSSGIAS